MSSTEHLPDGVEGTDRPLTVALVNSGRKWIGEVAHVAMLYEQLGRLGHHPWIVCRKGYRLEAFARRSGWNHLALQFNSRFNPWSDLKDLVRWLRWARRIRPDVIHCHRGKDHWLGRALAYGIHRPLVRTRHTVMPIRRHWLNRWFYLRATDAIICVSQAARSSFGPWRNLLPHGRVILSAVDTERFRPDRRSEPWRLGQPVAGGVEEPIWFGCIGRLNSIKGHKYFLEAAARVAAACPQARFLIAGAGSEGRRAEFASRAAQMGLSDRLVIDGYVEDLPTVLASLDVGVIASIGSEGSSRIALEMMASGLPLVATKVGGIPEITNPSQGGLLVEPGAPEAMAEAMLAWAADPARRKSAGCAARHHVLQAHDPCRWAKKMIAVYRLVCPKRN